MLCWRWIFCLIREGMFVCRCTMSTGEQAKIFFPEFLWKRWGTNRWYWSKLLIFLFLAISGWHFWLSKSFPIPLQNHRRGRWYLWFVGIIFPPIVFPQFLWNMWRQFRAIGIMFPINWPNFRREKANTFRRNRDRIVHEFVCILRLCLKPGLPNNTI